MNIKRNNVLTASRMNGIMRCPRQHYWIFEVGLSRDDAGLALRIGSAWARAMEARWNQDSYEDALAAAIPEGVEMDNYACGTVSALLAAYYDVYGASESVGKLHPEVEFGYELGLGFILRGKLDGLGSMKDGLSCIVEAKTTSDSLAQDSDYWLRLTFNMQVYQYILAARHAGWDVAKVFYDVTRKPTIRPKNVDNLDAQGKKIVVDKNGTRVFIESGKNKGQPRQGGDTEKGYYIKSHIETPDEYCDRLYKDALSRPDFYFARREIPVIDQQLVAFEKQRIAIAKMILSMRDNEAELDRPEDAWPRNVSENTCNFCSFKSFCLQNISIDLNHLPQGFEIKPFNPELDYATANSTIEENVTAASA